MTKWINESSMTKEEKNKNPDYKTSGGYLKKYEYKEAFIKSFEMATKEDTELLLRLPNFNYKIFEEISGITRKMINQKLNTGAQAPF